MIAAYGPGQALLTIVIFVAWVAFIGVAIWLLISLVRNKDFISKDIGLKVLVIVLLGVFAVFLPLLGVPLLFVIWFTKRSRAATRPGSGEGKPEAPPGADGATYSRRLPFPPPSAPEDSA